jgi:hypothetical protein
MTIVDSSTFPALHAAFKEIECDNGGHLVGTVYPGTPIDLERFTVPEAWAHLVAPAEAALTRLRALSEDDWSTFITGEFSDGERIRERQGDLEEARQLLNDWFEGWPAP